MVFGLDMRFLGGKWQRGKTGNGKGNIFNCFALRASLSPSAER
jgi:hypothetical protein